MNEGLKPYLEDNMHAWEMQPDGTFKRLKRGRAKGVSAQQELLKALAG
jgi:polyphosphate kinase